MKKTKKIIPKYQAGGYTANNNFGQTLINKGNQFGNWAQEQLPGMDLYQQSLTNFGEGLQNIGDTSEVNMGTPTPQTQTQQSMYAPRSEYQYANGGNLPSYQGGGDPVYNTSTGTYSTAGASGGFTKAANASGVVAGAINPVAGVISGGATAAGKIAEKIIQE